MTRTCSYCGETGPATLASCPSCGRSYATGQLEHVMTPPAGTAIPPGANDGLYTQMALKAVDLSDTFNALFGEPMPGWSAEMGRPGMSTAGGRQAKQHIGLRRLGGRGAGTIVIGSVDQGAQRAELRSYRRVDAMHRERFKKALPIRAPDWDRFAQRLVQFFREEGMVVRVESGAGRDDETDELDAPRGSATAVWILLACLVVAAVAGIGTWAYLKRTQTPAPPPVAAPPGWPAGVPPPLLPPLPLPGSAAPAPPLLPPLPPRTP